MGTPDFAVPCLEALNTNGYDVTLVITKEGIARLPLHLSKRPPYGWDMK